MYSGAEVSHQWENFFKVIIFSIYEFHIKKKKPFILYYSNHWSLSSLKSVNSSRLIVMSDWLPTWIIMFSNNIIYKYIVITLKKECIIWGPRLHFAIMLVLPQMCDLIGLLFIEWIKLLNYFYIDIFL